MSLIWDNLHTFISMPRPLKFQTCVFTCHLHIFTWKLNKHFKVNIFITELLLFPSKPVPFVLFPISVDVNSSFQVLRTKSYSCLWILSFLHIHIPSGRKTCGSAFKLYPEFITSELLTCYYLGLQTIFRTSWSICWAFSVLSMLYS